MLNAPLTTYRLSAGTVLQGRYEIKEAVAEGGFATVYSGHQRGVDRPIAVKVLNPNGDEEAQKIIEEKFMIEATSSSEIQHPNVVTIYDYGLTETTRQPYIVMELLDGHNVEQALRHYGAMDPQRALRLLLPALEALAEAHRLEIVHRDLKPANLFIVNPGSQREMLKVLDFGIARVRAIHATSSTGNGQLLGSPRYLAPEYLTQRIVTPALDVYQIGLVLVEMLTGTPVVDTKNPYHCIWYHSNGELLVPDDLMVGPLGPIIMGALDPNHAARFANIGALRKALLTVDARRVARPGAARSRLADFAGRVHSAAALQAPSPFDSPTIKRGADPVEPEQEEVFSDPTVPFDMRKHVGALESALAAHARGEVPNYKATPASDPGGALKGEGSGGGGEPLDQLTTSAWASGPLKRSLETPRAPKPMAVSINMPARQPTAPLPSQPTVVKPPGGAPPFARPAAPGAQRRPAASAPAQPVSPLLIASIMILGAFLFASALVCGFGALLYNRKATLDPPPRASGDTPVADGAIEPLAANQGAPTELPVEPAPAAAQPDPTSAAVKVRFNTEPPGATLKEFDAVLGVTPFVLDFTRKGAEGRRLQIELKGYKATYVDLSAQDAPGLTVRLTPEGASPASDRPQPPGGQKGAVGQSSSDVESGKGAGARDAPAQPSQDSKAPLSPKVPKPKGEGGEKAKGGKDSVMGKW